ncbi:MAG: penicillin-binding protein 1C [Bacteroidetes bacterium]|nr:penicillin-binding protein 1C [Bacteroidota bacterium]MCW5896999.1 penicillin-binding protein 1C [Bacteroidota bacterium]
MLKISAVAFLGSLGMFVILLYVPLDRELFSPAQVTSLRMYDKHGTMLREVLSGDEGKGRWCNLGDISPHVVDAVIATEDSRFYRHPGVDPLAVTRATVQNIRAGRVVSGGSTVTMQVIRNVFRPKRTFAEKLREAWYALRLERMMSKEEILVQYLNRVSFGNQTSGVDAAARVYFGKPAKQLSLAESAFLVAIPNSPTLNDPYNRFERVRNRQLYVLGRMKSGGFISDEEYERAEHEPLVLVPRSARFKAPHLTTMILSKLSEKEKGEIAEIHTTIDLNVQKSAELLLQAHLARLKKHAITNGAIVVIDNRTRELAALVGSVDFFDTIAGGQVNGALALRQPGSTLKPFTYGMALEHGMTAAELLADIPRMYGDGDVDLLPENYDKKYHGPVRLRTALACSYNVPAVRTAERFGTELLLQTLHSAGFSSLNQPSSFYGVGLTLGNGEVNLLELANAYSMLAAGGHYSNVLFIDSVKLVGGPREHLKDTDADRQVFSEQVAYLLTDILSDPQARAPAFGANSSLNLPFPCAAKTGTSKDYKDNWTVGYTPLYTVAVWVGNFNAKPMKLVSGITGAAPLFRDIMLLLHQSAALPSVFTVPEGIVTMNICPRSGMLVSRDCPGEFHESFISGTEPHMICSVHRRIALDRRNGLRASRNTPSEFVEERAFEIFPPIFDSWTEKEGLPRPPSGVSAKPDRHDVPLALSSPTRGDVFRLDPVLRPEFQSILIESLVSPDVENVSLWLNGAEISTLQPPYTFRLPLASLNKGHHTLMLKGQKGASGVQSEPVSLDVQ